MVLIICSRDEYEILRINTPQSDEELFDHTDLKDNEIELSIISDHMSISIVVDRERLLKILKEE